jgi:LysM repeat protein
MQAVEWVGENVPRDAFVMINSYALLEVRTHPLTHWYWKVERDPEIRDDILYKNWRGVDYAIVTPNMEEEARSGVIPFVSEIMSHGKAVAYFSSDGYWVKVLRIGAPSPASVGTLESRSTDTSTDRGLEPRAQPEASGQAANVSQATPNIVSPPVTPAEDAAAPTGATALPRVEPAPTPAANDASFTVYTVVRGDNLWNIGKKFGIDLKSIYELNRGIIGNDPDLIMSGQQLKIPAGTGQ